jgi:tetratricopeptide (TPR) repeat protein
MKHLSSAGHTRHALIFIFAFCFTLSPAGAAAEAVRAGSGRMHSAAAVQDTLGRLEAGFADVKQKGALSFEQQKMLATTAGECISLLVELSQQADLTQAAAREEFKALFLKNADLLRRMIAYNQARLDDVLEAKAGGGADKDAVFSAPEWQQAQYLTSLSGYWLAWSGYYGALLCTDTAADRAELLEEAVSGFTRAALNFTEPSIAGRSIMGRALCFKELKQYDKAQQDLQSVMKRVPRDNSLYAQAGYERALISYQSGERARAVQQVRELEDAVKPKTLPLQIREKLHRLQTTIALGIVEKQPEAQAGGAKKTEREAVQELRRIAAADESQAAVLYQYVLGHAAALSKVPEAELGDMGTMAIADWYFEQKQYGPAIERYQRLYRTPDPLVKQHLDDVYFRLAYALAQGEHWQDSLSCLETLFAKYPGSSFSGRAACLYYVAAVRTYTEHPAEAAYSRYIKAAECYVKNCPDARDKSEAHYQLGLCYQHKGRNAEALREFALVKSDSPHFTEAQQEGLRSAAGKLQAQTEKIEMLVRQGQKDEALKLYSETMKQTEAWQKTSGKKGATAGSEADAQMAYLTARLYSGGPCPDPQKALQLLQGFETRYAAVQQRDFLCGMVKGLRLACYLQLYRFKDAEKEVKDIESGGLADQAARSFLSDCADRHYNAAVLAKGSGDAVLAKREAQAALIIYKKLSGTDAAEASDKKHDEALQLRMAELFADTDQPAQAEALYRKKLAQDPASADAMRSLGAVLEQQGKWQDAFDTWQKFSRGLKPGTPPWFEVRYREACSLISLGKNSDACEVIAATKIRFQDFGGGEYAGKFLRLNETMCGVEKGKKAQGTEAQGTVLSNGR